MTQLHRPSRWQPAVRGAGATAPAEPGLLHPTKSPPGDTLGRTKKLILAAVRVWELKQGIRR